MAAPESIPVDKVVKITINRVPIVAQMGYWLHYNPEDAETHPTAYGLSDDIAILCYSRLNGMFVASFSHGVWTETIDGDIMPVDWWTLVNIPGTI